MSSSTTTTNKSGSGGSHGYCLKWKYHPNNLLHMFNQLLLNESFTDVVVACEGGQGIKCHKMVLSACSKYFEQVFTEYPQQSSTLVILKDMKFADVQAIIEFMYQGEINVAHDQLASLLKAAESLQVKGLADITGTSGGGTSSSAVGASLTNNKEDSNDYHDDDDNPPSPAGVGGGGGGGGDSEDNLKRKRRQQFESIGNGLSIQPGSGSGGGGSSGLGLSGIENSGLGSSSSYDDYSLGNLLSDFALQSGSSPLGGNRKIKARRKVLMGGGEVMEQIDDDDDNEHDMINNDDDEVTEDDVQNIVKMTEYIEKGGSRPQFWEEPTTKKIMNAIRSKKMEMKAAAEILGVSYSTLYSRYRELHGYLKMPHTQDTNFNYYQVLNLLRAGQITLPDAAKRLNIHEKTLGSYLSTTITPKKPRLSVNPNPMQQQPSSSLSDPQNYALNLLGHTQLQGNQIASMLGGDNYSDDDDDEEDEEEEEDSDGNAAGKGVIGGSGSGGGGGGGGGIIQHSSHNIHAKSPNSWDN